MTMNVAPAGISARRDQRLNAQVRKMEAEMAWTEADDDRVRELCKTADVGKMTS